MSEIEVQPVATKQQKKQFFHLPWQLYRGDPNWVPPLRQNQLELLNYRRHPFYDEAEIQTFLALRGGEPCGRVAAVINHAHNRYAKESRGFFGFFESVDDPQVAAALFGAARQWCASRGMTALRGPVNPSQNYECGLLIDGFDSPPTFMMTYNPPFYARLVEGCGFSKSQEMYAYWGNVDMLQHLDKKLQFIIDESKRRFNFHLRNLDRSHFKEDVRKFLDVFNCSFVGSWGFVPLSEAEIEHASVGLRQLIVPELTAAAEVDGKMVGAVFGLLDYNPRIKKIDGRLFPFGFIRLLWNRRAIPRVRLVSTNVIPEYQKWGLGLVLMNKLLPDALAYGLKEAEFSWVMESNHLSKATLERGGAKRVKTWRIYDAVIGDR